jgi:retinol dehydrogenase 12
MSSPKRLILAVRNLDEGNKAKNELMGRKPTSTEIEVRKLDQSNFESVASFAKSLKGDRVDFAILNAGESRHCVRASRSDCNPFSRCDHGC